MTDVSPDEAHEILAVCVKHRQKLRITQQEIAAELGVTRNRVTQIETGENDIRVTQLLKYMKAVGLRLAVIVPEVSIPQEIIFVSETQAKPEKERNSARAPGRWLRANRSTPPRRSRCCPAPGS
jgi:transcriptional regulator with XRE-family HTH domain